MNDDNGVVEIYKEESERDIARANLNLSHPDGADPLVKPLSVRERPGRLETAGAAITLQTRQAHGLFYGRRGDKENNVFPIVGLVRFAKNIGEVWHSSENDDPYADLVLIDVEQKFEDAMAFIVAQHRHIDKLLTGQLEGIELPETKSKSPAKMDIQFYSPWAYRAAILLTNFDRLVTIGMTARKMGLMFEDDWAASIVKCSSKIRALFEASRAWKMTSVKRDDIAANNKVAERAVKVYASHKPSLPEISEDVLKGITRAQLSPRIKNKAVKTPDAV